MSVVLITGVTGRVGSQLARELIEEGNTVRGLALPDDPLLSRVSSLADLELRSGDLRDETALREATTGVDTVVHLAAQMILNGSPLDLYEVNVMGTMRLLEAVAAAGGQTGFLLASTDGTYGVINPQYLPINENHPQTPGDYYSGSKVLAERLLENYAAQFDIPYAILRFSTVISPSESLGWFRYESSLERLRRVEFGRRTNLWRLFVDHPEMYRLLLAAVPDPTGNPAVALLGPGRRPWEVPVTDVRDITQAIRKTIAQTSWPNDAFNISGLAVPSDYGAHVIATALQLPVHVVELPVYWHYDIDTRKARDKMGFAPIWGFEATVQDALASSSGLG